MERKELEQVLDLLEDVHVAIWLHFDPEGNLGDKGQPKEMRKLLLKIRAYCRSHGKVMEGWKR